MKKRKIESVIFHMLYVLPFLIVMVYWIWQIVYSKNHEYTMTISTLFQSLINVFENTTTGLIYQPINYLLVDIMHIGTNLSSIIAYYIEYCVIIEFVHICYCVMIFIPRVCSNIFHKGVGE